MIVEYNVTLENKTKSELILFIKELQDMLKEKDAEIEKLKADNKNVWNLNANMSKRHLTDIFKIKKKDKIIDLMATFIDAQNTRMLEDEYTAIKNIYTIIGLDKDKEDIKQYFERKVKRWKLK